MLYTGNPNFIQVPQIEFIDSESEPESFQQKRIAEPVTLTFDRKRPKKDPEPKIIDGPTKVTLYDSDVEQLTILLRHRMAKELEPLYTFIGMVTSGLGDMNDSGFYKPHWKMPVRKYVEGTTIEKFLEYQSQTPVEIMSDVVARHVIQRKPRKKIMDKDFEEDSGEGLKEKQGVKFNLALENKQMKLELEKHEKQIIELTTMLKTLESSKTGEINELQQQICLLQKQHEKVVGVPDNESEEGYSITQRIGAACTDIDYMNSSMLSFDKGTATYDIYCLVLNFGTMGSLEMATEDINEATGKDFTTTELIESVQIRTKYAQYVAAKFATARIKDVSQSEKNRTYFISPSYKQLSAHSKWVMGAKIWFETVQRRLDTPEETQRKKILIEFIAQRNKYIIDSLKLDRNEDETDDEYGTRAYNHMLVVNARPVIIAYRQANTIDSKELDLLMKKLASHRLYRTRPSARNRWRSLEK